MTPVSDDLLLRLARSVPRAPAAAASEPHGQFDLDRWIAEYAPDAIGPTPWGNGGRKWVFPVCPWDPAHTNRSAYIVEFANGAVAAGCHHNGCSGNDWHALRDRREPGWRDAHARSTSNMASSPNTCSLGDVGNDGNLAAAEPPHNYSLVRLSDVQPRKVEWLWRGRIPLGKATVLDGDPGLGKSVVTLDISSRVSTGREMPDGTYGDLDGPAGVLLLSAEDDPADTIRPRLDAVGADATRICILTEVPDEEGKPQMPAIPGNLQALESAIYEIGAKLVVVDPIMAYLGGEVNAHRDQDVRRALAPLAQMAERTGAAVVIVRHLNKAAGDNPLYRGGGSIGIIGAARSGLLVAKDPDDPSEKLRILASSKSNLAVRPQSLVYYLEEAENGSVKVVWNGTSEKLAGDLLRGRIEDEDGGELREAKDFLLTVLADGPVLAVDVLKESKNAGIAERTLRRAKAALDVRSTKRGDGRWDWALQEEEGRGGPVPSTGRPAPTTLPTVPTLPRLQGQELFGSVAPAAVGEKQEVEL